MGKFFTAGLLLGAAVTWAMMHYFFAKGLDDPEVQEELKNQYNLGRMNAKGEADKEWQKKLDKKQADLKREHDNEVGPLREQVEALKTESKKLEIKVDSALEDVKIARDARDKARAGLAEIQSKPTTKSTASKDLLVRITKLRDVKLRIHREFGEACTAIKQALIAWPDVALAGEVARGIVELATRHRKLAQDVRVYILQHSKGLSQELGDLASYRAGVQEKDVDAVDLVAARIAAAVRSMKTDSVIVEAAKEQWTDSEVFVKAGDVIQVRTTGTWRMALNLAAAGADGWDEASQYKIYRKARAGSLILQIGQVSERMDKAYLGTPITARSGGRVKFRMNDKSVRDNGGSIKVDVVSSSPKALEGVLKLWNEFKKQQP